MSDRRSDDSFSVGSNTKSFVFVGFDFGLFPEFLRAFRIGFLVGDVDRRWSSLLSTDGRGCRCCTPSLSVVLALIFCWPSCCSCCWLYRIPPPRRFDLSDCEVLGCVLPPSDSKDVRRMGDSTISLMQPSFSSSLDLWLFRLLT